jgi:hypothetical protein
LENFYLAKIHKKLPAGNKEQPSNQVARGQLASLLKMKILPLSWA